MPIDPDTPDLSTPPALPEAVVADAVAAHAAEPGGHGHQPAHTHCENCGTELRGPFCHRCGQHDFEFHRSFGHVFLEALENFFHFDEKLFRNVVTLLFHPGRLTAAFNAGKRAAQMPPFRLYLFVSVLFFFVRFLGINAETANEPVELQRKTPAQTMEETRQTVTEALQEAKSEFRRVKQPQASADTANTGTDGKAPSPGKPRAKSVTERQLNEKLQRALEHREELVHSFIHALPKLLLVCLPLFALYTRVLFRRHGYVYLQHLVLALHYHTFVYLWWLVLHGWSGLAEFLSPTLASTVTSIAATWLVVYPVFMLRHLFGQSWVRTAFKTALLAVTYVTTLGFGLLATIAVLFWMV